MLWSRNPRRKAKNEFGIIPPTDTPEGLPFLSRQLDMRSAGLLNYQGVSFPGVWLNSNMVFLISVC